MREEAAGIVRRVTAWVVAGCLALGLAGAEPLLAASPGGDPQRGARLFQQCAACHSTEPGQHFTGPSLAHIWGRKAATVEGFDRYSDALKAADLVWNAATLKAWLRDPAALVPGNAMRFAGVPEAKGRADLIAYLEAVSTGRMAGSPGGGMMGARPPVNLKTLGKEYLVRSIRYCKDAYYVTTENGETRPYWEFNLRLKTDGSARGPAKGKPVLIPAGMMGDRAFVVFADPGEISPAMEHRCPR